MADSTTTNLLLTKPEVGASTDTWGGKVNTDLDLVDAVFAAAGTGTSVGLNVGAGKTLKVAGTTDFSANLTFTGTGNRITGDFSNATENDRVTFENSVTNQSTNVSVIPNGTSQSSRLQVFNNSNKTNASLNQIVATASEAQYQSGITGTGTYLPMTFFTGGSERVRIDTSGNAGIGTSSPGSKLHVATAANSGVLISSTDGTTFKGIAFNTNDNQFTVGTTTNHPLAFFTNNSERARIDSSGNVGIGTSSPSGRLDVESSSTVLYTNLTTTAGGAASVLSLIGGSSSEQAICYNSSALRFGTVTGKNAAGFTERARIDSSGILLVGTTSSAGLNGKIVSQIDNTKYSFASNQTGATNFYHCVFYQNSTQVGSITSTATTTSYVTLSDYRLKNTIAPMTGALDKVAQLKPVTYKWKVDGLDGQGFIAHELQEVCPDAVTGEKDGEQMQGVDYGKLTPILTAALQEAIAKIETLEARISALEAK